MVLQTERAGVEIKVDPQRSPASAGEVYGLGNCAALAQAGVAPCSATHYFAQHGTASQTSVWRRYNGGSPKRSTSGARKSPITPRAMSACMIA
jgi:hypothetical protein